MDQPELRCRVIVNMIRAACFCGFASDAQSVPAWQNEHPCFGATQAVIAVCSRTNSAALTSVSTFTFL